MKTTEGFEALVNQFTAAVEAGDGSALASLFTEDGVYEDGFYGASTGRTQIKAMLETKFWGHAEGFRWRMLEPVCDGRHGYARYVFSYRSKLACAVGETVVFEGMSQFTLEGDLIRRYREVFETGIAMAQLRFSAERIAKSLERRASALREGEKV